MKGRCLKISTTVAVLGERSLVKIEVAILGEFSPFLKKS